MEERIINFEALGTPLKDIDEVLNTYDIEEKKYIIQVYLGKLGTRIRQQKMQDDLQNNKLYRFAQKMMPKEDE